jgi:hypothetical protein
MKIDIIEWVNGKFSVRRRHWLWGREYLTINSSEPLWVSKGSEYFHYCYGSTIKECVKSAQENGDLLEVKQIINPLRYPQV